MIVFGRCLRLKSHLRPSAITSSSWNVRRAPGWLTQTNSVLLGKRQLRIFSGYWLSIVWRFQFSDSSKKTGCFSLMSYWRGQHPAMTFLKSSWRGGECKRNSYLFAHELYNKLLFSANKMQKQRMYVGLWQMHLTTQWEPFYSWGH